MKLAPIGMSVYTRIDHFRRSIEALLQNTLASESNLYIYSDAASKKEDESLVAEIREYAHSISGFKSVSVIERETNYGGIKNSWLACLEVVEKSKVGYAIYLEDDIEVALGYLAFMNAALDFYRDDDTITAVTGYSPNVHMPADNEDDIFVLTGRGEGWGTGLYPRTVEAASQRIDKREFESLEQSVLDAFGEDMLYMIELEANGELNAGDVRLSYYQAVNNKYMLYPKLSLVQNIGLDGSGEHCGVTSKYDHDQLWDKSDGFVFVKGILPDSRIVEKCKQLSRVSRRTKFSYMLRKRAPVLYSLYKSIKRLIAD